MNLASVLARSSTHLIHDARLRERRTGRRAREVVAWTRWSGCALRLTRRRSARALVTTAERTNERTNGGRARGGPNRRRSTSGSTLGRADAAVEVEEELAVGGGAGDVGGPSILDEVREELRLAGMTLGDDGES